MKAMILTAGLGTRLRPVTDVYAKPAVPFLNVPLLFYSLALVRQAGVSSVVFNTHHKPEQIEALGRSIQQSFHVVFSAEPGAPLGSGGGIHKARKFLEGSGNFLVCNGDEVILPLKEGAITRFLKTHQESGALATLLVMKHPGVGTQFGGVWTTENNHVLGFGKDRSKFPSAPIGYHYIGVLLLNDRVFKYFPEGESNILYDVLQEALSEGEKVLAHVEEFTWFETGNAEDFLSATRKSLELLTSADPTREDAKFLKDILRTHFSKEPQVKVESGYVLMSADKCRIDSKTRFEGFVVIGEGAVIESDVELKNCVILPNANVRAGSRIEKQIVF